MKSTTQKPLMLTDVFTQDAIDKLFKADHKKIIYTMHVFYDDAFVYGAPGHIGNYNTLSMDERAYISILYRAVCSLFELASVYIENGNNLQEIVNKFDDLIDNAETEICNILETIMMVSVHYKWQELGNPNEECRIENNNNYYNYLTVKQILQGYKMKKKRKH